MRPLIALATIIATPAFSEVPRVVTDIPAVHSLAAQVMGDLGEPMLLLSSGADPHHFQMKPSQASALSKADLLFWVGPELTPWLDRAVSGIGVAGTAIELLEVPGTTTHSFAEEHDEHEEEHVEEGHDHEGLDPHAWLDPANASTWIAAMAAELATADPEHADVYLANAAAADGAITATTAQINATLAPAQGVPIMMFHDAYTYFAEAFGLNIVGSITMGDAAAPGAARLAHLRDELAHEGVVCIFPEAQHDPAYLTAIVEGSEVKTGAPLDPSGSSLPYGASLYSALLTGLAQTIADCVNDEG
ncbi:zinc ABC transporter substrate-binding protein [Actibacterium lipolyticum]|uniref:High-affinity zinc uptake system protein ZnuA n=1 Tax=Actibacterium lipolyticum TaxID=1524263 RepID=A0A238KRU7_9RHOB|nr:zinc ABC transporter substrate-binding protein [Actibacterium lipolyticum]SMX44852.1 High-affinity zinc uptake system protein ZnuA precursor [Actibacterium lipolyticum]